MVQKPAWNCFFFSVLFAITCGLIFASKVGVHVDLSVTRTMLSWDVVQFALYYTTKLIIFLSVFC